MSDIHSILNETTKVFRKGAEVIEHAPEGGVRVTEVYGYPHYEGPEATGYELVDMHFVVVGVDRAKAEAQRDAFMAWLATYPQQDRLAGGPSYIEFAPEAGMEQEGALRVFALGRVLGLWAVITPATLGYEGRAADELAGSGFVMMSGYKGSNPRAALIAGHGAK